MHAIDALHRTEAERDRLREALQQIESMDWYDGNAVCGLARAALAATEEPKRFETAAEAIRWLLDPSDGTTTEEPKP